MRQPPQPTRRAEFTAGLRDTIPMVVGAIPFGIIFGALAVTSGISPAGALGMSAFVFAGSSQFIATGLVSTATPLLVIVFTTLIVNLRHALYSATLAPHMKHLSQKWLLPLGFWLTDESFVVVVARYTQPDTSPYKHWYHLGSSVFMYTNWCTCTVIGIVAGQSIPDMRNWGLDFAMIVTFIGVLIPTMTNRPMILATVVAGVSAVMLNGMPNKLGLLVAALLGVIAGYIAESLAPKASTDPLITVPDAGSESLP